MAKKKEKVQKQKVVKKEGCETEVVHLLQLKKFDTKQKILNELVKKGFDTKKAKSALSNILGYIRNKKEKRWAKYTWNEKEFLLTKKE